MQDHKEWLAFAERDLKAAKILLISQEAILPLALYHTQQSAEKSLKAFLVCKSGSTGKIHDLVRLVTECALIDPEFNSLMSHAVDLNPYLTGTRYPDAYLPIPDISIGHASVKSATIILEFVKDKIL